MSRLRKRTEKEQNSSNRIGSQGKWEQQNSQLGYIRWSGWVCGRSFQMARACVVRAQFERACVAENRSQSQFLPHSQAGSTCVASFLLTIRPDNSAVLYSFQVCQLHADIVIWLKLLPLSFQNLFPGSSNPNLAGFQLCKIHADIAIWTKPVWMKLTATRANCLFVW